MCKLYGLLLVVYLSQQLPPVPPKLIYEIPYISVSFITCKRIVILECTVMSVNP